MGGSGNETKKLQYVLNVLILGNEPVGCVCYIHIRYVYCTCCHYQPVEVHHNNEESKAPPTKMSCFMGTYVGPIYRNTYLCKTKTAKVDMRIIHSLPNAYNIQPRDSPRHWSTHIQDQGAVHTVKQEDS